MHTSSILPVLLCTTLLQLSAVIGAKNLVLIGGGLDDDNAPIWNKIIDLAGGVGVARVGIVTAASFDPLDSAEYYEEMLLLYGAAETYWIPVHEANKPANSDPTVVSNIRRMTGFMFGGGDQSRVTNSFFNEPGRVESPALTAIRETYEAGAVLAGSSAGIACHPWAVMIAGGVTYNGLRYGSFPLGSESSSSDLVYDPFGGLGMLYDYIIDSHFSERGREGRLIRLVADTRSGPRGVQYAFGVDEDTALVITDGDTAQAVGEVVGIAGVGIVDLSRAFVDPGSQYFRILDVHGHYLTQGDRINLRTLTVTYDTSWKSNLAGNEFYDNALTSNNIFGGHILGRVHSEFVRVSTSLFDSRLDFTTTGATVENNPRFQVTFTQEPGLSTGYGGYSPVTGYWEISYSNLKININAL